MASVLRFGGLRLINFTEHSLLNLRKYQPTLQQACLISGKTLRGTQKLVKSKPYDYKNKGYNVFNAIFDKTTHRMDENSKIIVVEGPLAAGKSKFAKELAEELDMLYLPEANMDMIFINPYGYDMRKLDPQLPESCKSFDVKNFCKTPNHVLAGQLQIRMYMLRFSQYIDALAHVLSTGQGVVLDRSPYSDYVFTEAMFNSNYISKGVRSVYYDIRNNTITELMKPHLVIYLDVPVDTVKQRIKERNIDYEVNSKALTDKYLQDIDSVYKHKYLKEISVASELLVYDWSSGGETEVVVEDIERIDFDRFEKHDPKLKEWRLPKEWDWCEVRMTYADQKDVLMNYFNIPRFDVPELMRSGQDSKVWHDVWFDAPGMKYAWGYNSDMGDTGLLTNNKLKNWDNV